MNVLLKSTKGTEMCMNRDMTSLPIAGEIQAPCLRMGAVESPNKSLIIPAGQSQLRSRSVTNIFDF